MKAPWFHRFWNNAIRLLVALSVIAMLLMARPLLERIEGKAERLKSIPPPTSTR